MTTRKLNGCHAYYEMHIHLVLVTKYRHKCITREMAERIDSLVSGVCLNSRCQLDEANGESDHRHFLIRINPNITVSKLVNTIKTNTSRIVRKEFATHLKSFYWKPVFWSRSYCVITAGGANLDTIKQYIEIQSGAA